MNKKDEKKKLPLNRYREFFSQPKSIKIYIPDKSFNHDGNEARDDDFVGRVDMLNKLFKWLTDEKQGKGSYLVTGYRGMGKTSLVNRVLDRITRELNQVWELACFGSLASLVIGTILLLLNGGKIDLWVCPFWIISFILFVIIIYNQKRYKISKYINRHKFPRQSSFKDKDIDKMVDDQDESEKDYSRIKININLGHEVINERDILCLIVCNIKEKYNNFVKSRQNKFLFVYITMIILCWATYRLDNKIYESFKDYEVIEYNDVTIINNNVQSDGTDVISQSEIKTIGTNYGSNDSWFSRLMANIWKILKEFRKNDFLKVVAKSAIFLILLLLLEFLGKRIMYLIPFISDHHKMMKRLNDLSDRLNSSVDENSGNSSSFDRGFISVSLFGNRKRKISPMADIREIEAELIDIVNRLYSNDWKPLKRFKLLSIYRVTFFIVFDELDKIDPDITDDKVESYIPEYSGSVKGFPSGIETRDRRRNVLKLLANIKLFISTANAKFVFISGRELYDAYLADLSDRDFAISSIFSGVINVDSFLSPEGGQTDVRSMTELYVANRLIPKTYLIKKEREYASNDKILKKEIPSLRWYYEYLMGLEGKSPEQKVDVNRQKDIEFVMIFLRGFAAYLSHISNGSPKKIYLYFDKYVKNDIDTYTLNDWDDEIVVGKSEGNDKQPVLYFNVTQQNCINFIHYLSGPIMSTITNDLSGFGDRYLVSLSFVIDHIYKHHSRSFSWRDMEQIPELLKTSKAPELRKSMSSIMEFLMQIHISPIVVGFKEYKFHKSISEEIDYMSKISDEASALFNFTLDESLAVIHHNTMLLNRYNELSKKKNESENKCNDEYKPVIARIHSVLGDLHFGDEDYYNATMEYKLALNLNGNNDGYLLTMIRISLKIGLTYEYRKMYPNAYYSYCQLIKKLVELRNINEKDFGLNLCQENTYDWRYHRQLYVNQGAIDKSGNDSVFESQFDNCNIDDYCMLNKSKDMVYCQSIDGVISEFSKDLTPEKAALISELTMFEEIRYFNQAILAKLFSVEKMMVSGITQTNIDVAESEFEMLHRIINVEEKFIVASDFFCKLAEILYYKNSLTILTKNQDTLEAALHFHNFDVYACLEDYLFYCKNSNSTVDARAIKNDVKFFFESIYAVRDEKGKNCFVDLSELNECRDIKLLFVLLQNGISEYYKKFVDAKIINDDYAQIAETNVRGYLKYCLDAYSDKEYKKHFDFDFDTVVSCPTHRMKLNKSNLRPPCYACKYYTRSLKILIDKMIIGDMNNVDCPSKSLDILRYTFKSNLRYSRVNQVVALAKAIEGMGNIMLSCASFDQYEATKNGKKIGISPKVIKLLVDLAQCDNAKNQENVIENGIRWIKDMTRLDKCLVYYWDAYRYYLIVSQYDDAINCLNKILTMLTYYINILNYSKSDKECVWDDETKTVFRIIGKSYRDENSLLSIIFRLILRHTGFQYDNSGLIEIHELKWLLSKDDFETIDFSKLSRYPNIRATVLRLLEINMQGRYYIEYKKDGIWGKRYRDFLVNTYRIVSPSRRYVTTTYEDVLGYYVKTIYNGCIIKDILDGNKLLDKSRHNMYDKKYPLNVYKALREYLSDENYNKHYLVRRIFNTENNSKDKLELLEYVIQDSLVCLTNMIKVFTPHNHFTSYSKSFIAITYNLLWEWSRYYELLYWIYDYKHYFDLNDEETMNTIIDKLKKPTGIESSKVEKELKNVINDLCSLIPSPPNDGFGDLCSRLYSKLKHDMDDVAINLIFSNYSAESALNYYYMAEETNTEGDAYKDLISNLFFLNDDLNNDTCQFNLACERFLMNCDVVKKQKIKLHELYEKSNVYIPKNYIEGPKNVWDETDQQNKNRFNRSKEINSEY